MTIRFTLLRNWTLAGLALAVFSSLSLFARYPPHYVQVHAAVSDQNYFYRDIPYPPPPQWPDRCRDKMPVFNAQSGAKIRLTGPNYDATFIAEDGTQLVRIEKTSIATIGDEKVLIQTISRLVPGGGDGLGTLAAYAYMQAVSPIIMNDLGMTSLKIIWTDVRGLRWDCLKDLMGYAPADKIWVDDAMMDFFIVRK